MARPWWWRKRVWVPALVLVALAAAIAAVVVPSLPAIRFLRTLASPEPDATWARPRLSYEPSTRASSSEGSPTPVDAPVWLWKPGSTEPAVLVVHGLTESGLDDPRIWRLAAALEDAGLAPRVPRIDGFVDPRDNASVVAGDPRLEAGLRGASPAPFGLLAVSVGAGPALRAAARAFRGGLRGPAAIFLVGAPDDVVTLARAWFAEPDAPPGAPAEAASRAEAGRFARLAILRAGLDDLVPTPDSGVLRIWLADPPEYRLPPPPAPESLSPEGRRFAAAAAAGPTVSDADRTWILAAVEPFLAALSPARFDADLDALRCPVFLIHGVDDPLVPPAEMERLRARLARRVRVEALESTVLSHVGVGDGSLSEKWRHVRFVQRFFDAVTAAR